MSETPAPQTQDTRICHAPGDRCLACDHYYGRSDRCKYAPVAPQGQDKIDTRDLLGCMLSDLGDEPCVGYQNAATALEALQASKIELAEHLDKVGDVAADAVSRAEKVEAENARLREHIVDAGSYQPMYNGRPSCPFCTNFVDDEETHLPGCIVVSCRAVLAEPGS